jgi:hypothetical protein
MSRSTLAAVLVLVDGTCEVFGFRDPHNRTVMLFDIDENYSLAAVQRMIDLNRARFGESARAVCELGRCRGVRGLLRWTGRVAKRRRTDRVLLGWSGPFRLPPDQPQSDSQ